MIGGVTMTHGDDKGLILPPLLAPYQAVIVLIGRGEQAGEVLAAARELAAGLHEAGVGAHLDDWQHLSPGFKFNDWEMRGVRSGWSWGRVNGGGHRADGHSARHREDAGPAGPARPAQRRADRLRGPAAAAGDRVPRSADRDGGHLGRVRGGGRDRLGPGIGCGQPECQDDIKAATSVTPPVIPETASQSRDLSGAGCRPPTGNALSSAAPTNAPSGGPRPGQKRVKAARHS